MTSVQEALSRALPAIANDLKNALREKSPVDLGNLRRSISVQVNSKGLLITMLDYGKDLEFGLVPKVVNLEEISDWAGRKLGDKSAGFPVARKIKRFGVRPQPFIRPTMHQQLGKIIVKRLKEELS